MRRLRLLRWFRSELWFVPLMCVGAAVLLSIGLLELDRRHPGLVPSSITGNSTTVSTILSTVATSMVTLTTLVLTITTVVVQLSMGQFSPRITPALLQDRQSQLAYGLFGATFTFAAVAIRALDEPKGFVPGVTVLTAYALTLASISTLFLYMHHSGQRLSPAGMIDLVGDRLGAQIEQYPRAEAPTAGDDELVLADRSGVVDVVDVDGLLALATSRDCRIAVVPRLGDFVPATAPLARVQWCENAVRRDLGDEVRRHMVMSSSRSHSDDPAYGMRKLVDIALRGLASGPFTDPTTAVQAIDRLHDAIRQLAHRHLPPTGHRDAHGAIRLVVPQLDWSGFIRLSFDEIRLAGAASPQVARRLRAGLEDLLSVVPADRHEPLHRQLRLLDAGVRRSFDNDDDAAAMSYPDAQGIGSGPDLMQPMNPETSDEEGEPEGTGKSDHGGTRLRLPRD
jgi:uncharacterized membrane protein